MKTEEKERVIESPLMQKKAFIKPIKRKGSWAEQLTGNENHDGSFLYSGTVISIMGIPYSASLRRRVNVLTEDEQEWFESKKCPINFDEGELSVHNDDSSFWDSFKVKLEKNGMSLDLNEPMDYLRYKFLLAQKDLIAPTWNERFLKGTYKFAVVFDDVEDTERVEKRNRLNKANRFFLAMEDSPSKMIAFLNLYYDGKKNVSENSNREFLVAEIDRIIETNITKFLQVCEDANYDTKAFINTCILKSLITKTGEGEYIIQGEDGTFTMTELIAFLKNKKNQAIYGRLKAMIE
jgi:hypothetical protein